MDAPHGHTTKILELAGELRVIADKIERETAASIIETRGPGLPCASEREWNAEPEMAVNEVADDLIEIAALHDEPPSRPAV